MSLTTFSTFYYGHEVTADNNTIDFKEGVGPTQTAEIQVGKYSLTDFAVAVRNALNDEGLLTYTVSINRVTRELTISASGTFSLLVNSGPTAGTSAFSLIGFSGADRTGAATYTGNLPSGEEYQPQFKLQSHVPKENFKRSVQASVNEAADGTVEVIRFGTVRFTQFDIQFATNIPMDGKVIKSNSTGVEDLNDFMDYVTKVAPIEFMPDISDRSTFETIQIDSTQQSREGIDYQLRELYDRGLPNFFNTGVLTFRVLD